MNISGKLLQILKYELLTFGKKVYEFKKYGKITIRIRQTLVFKTSKYYQNS